MEFKTLSIIKHPINIVWTAMRDHYVEIVAFVDEVDSIHSISRKKITPKKMEVVNIWKADPPIPEIISKQIKKEMLSWTDTAIWDEEKMICRWKIDSHYFKEKMNCKGFTKFEPAIGGRACRLSFQGSIDWDGNLPLSFGMADSMIAKTLESIISKVIPNNFRKLASGVAAFIEADKKN